MRPRAHGAPPVRNQVSLESMGLTPGAATLLPPPRPMHGAPPSGDGAPSREGRAPGASLAGGSGRRWNAWKIACYLFYCLVAKHLPEEWGPVGKISARIRRAAARPLFKESAPVVTVGRGADFGNGCNIVMKDHANIGSYALIEESPATVTIGKHVMMGTQCIIITQNHKYGPEGFDGFEGKDVVIGDFAWIGHRVTILPGVTIGSHAIVGAGSVVSRSIPDYAIAAGNPARVKKLRR